MTPEMLAEALRLALIGAATEKDALAREVQRLRARVAELEGEATVTPITQPGDSVASTAEGGPT